MLIDCGRVVNIAKILNHCRILLYLCRSLIIQKRKNAPEPTASLSE